VIEKIQELKKKRDAIILAHNYQIPEVQDIADLRGDSLELSRKAAQTDAKVIVFCGVHFMAETAAILSPAKTVLLPDIDAGCPLADMITVEALRELKSKYPGRPVVAYVNTSAAVKAESDYACTSANAVKVINAIKSDEIIFVPDKFLAAYVQSKTSKKIISWGGYCPTHAKIMPEDIIERKKEHPNAKVMSHPECRQEVLALSDAALSTSGMIKYAAENDAKEFIVGTEAGMVYRLQQDNPGKKFYAASAAATCPNMKRITLEKILWSLEDMKPIVTVTGEIRERALLSVQRMIDIATPKA